MDIPEGLTLPSPSGRKRSGASISLGIGRGEELIMLETVALRVNSSLRTRAYPRDKD